MARPTPVAAPPVAQTTAPPTVSNDTTNDSVASPTTEGGLAASFANRRRPLSFLEFKARRQQPKGPEEVKGTGPRGVDQIGRPGLLQGNPLDGLRQRLFGEAETAETETVDAEEENGFSEEEATANEATPENETTDEKGENGAIEAQEEEKVAEEAQEVEADGNATAGEEAETAATTNPASETTSSNEEDEKEQEEEEAAPGEAAELELTASTEDGPTPPSTPNIPTEAPAAPTTPYQPKEAEGGFKAEDKLSEMEGGPGAMQEMGEIPAPQLDTADSGALTDSLTGGSILTMAKGMENVGEAASEAKANETQTAQENLPEIDQPTGLVPGEDQDYEKIVPPQAPTPDLKNEGVRQTEQMDTTFEGPRSPVPGSNIARTTKSSLNSWEGFMGRMNRLPSTDRDLQTNMGQRPGVDLTGDASPQQNDKNEAQAQEEVKTQQNEADSATYQDFGENDVYPTLEPERMSPNTEMSMPENWESPEGGVEMPEMPAHIQSGLDPQIEAEYAGQVEEEKAKQDAEEANYESGVAAEQAEKMAEIEEENRKAGEEQAAVRAEGRTEIDGYRESWREENEAVKEKFKNSSETERAKVDAEVATEVDTANADVEKKYAETERENEAKQAEADREVAQEKAKAEEKKEEPSWWDNLVDAVSDLFNALKEFVNKVFDELRAFVKKAIEAAKSFANWVIEKARQAVVALIEGFAEVLKGFVSIALAAFPEIAEKINGYIDKAKDKAIAGVNAIAEGLKKAVNALLDALGAAIDFLLSAYQAFINLMLDVLEFLTVGLIRIVEGLINLGRGVAAMPDQFMGQMSEEALGTDVTSPLKGTERTDPEISTFDNYLSENNQALDPQGRVIDLPIEEDAEMATGQVEGDPGALPGKDPLSDQDFGLSPDSPVSMDDIEDMPQLADGESYELGGAPEGEAVETADLQSTFFGGARSMEGGDMAGADVDATAGLEGAAPEKDYASMTDQQKLDDQIDQMGMDVNEMDSKDTEPTKEEEETDPAGLVAKTGKLSVGDRLAFAGSQMLKGMEMWWNENQVSVYLALAGIAIVGGVIAFFTGGAGLIALLQVLMEIMMYYFIATAILRIKDLLWEFLELAWEGKQIKLAGEKLARALAVLISEFLFEYLLKKVGSVLKRIKALVKATRFGRKMAVAAHRTTKAIKAGARTVKGVIVKGGKYVMTTFKRGFGKGIKKLGELRQRILKKFGFKRIWLERHGRRLQLWGEFNAKVLLSDGTIDEVDNPSPGRLGSKTDGGIVLDHKGNQFSRSVENMSEAERKAMYSELDELTEEGRRQRIRNGNTKGGNSRVTPSTTTATEPEVLEFIQRFEQRYPGRSFKSGHDVTTVDGRLVEVDFETDNVIIEFKSNRGKGLSHQVIDRSNQGKVIIGVAGSSKGISKHALKSIEEAGGLGASMRDIEIILDLIRP